MIFDLGGVMVQINHTWEQAADYARVCCSNLTDGTTALNAVPYFEAYQAGELSEERYFENLGHFLGCTAEEALLVHDGILREEYPGVADFVQELMLAGIKLGCLSNTNAPHWKCLVETGPYPGIQALEIKMASHLMGLSKPDPLIFRTFCDATHIDAKQIIFFDDHPTNVLVAKNCGWTACQINPNIDTPPQMRSFLGELGVI